MRCTSTDCVYTHLSDRAEVFTLATIATTFCCYQMNHIVVVRPLAHIPLTPSSYAGTTHASGGCTRTMGVGRTRTRSAKCASNED